MLIAFSVENFRSIRDLQTLSLAEPRTDRHLEWSNLIDPEGRRLLKCVALFGPNASGKSNIITAMIWCGIGLSVLTVMGVSERWNILFSAAVWTLLWLIYLSLVNVGQTSSLPFQNHKLEA